ncbi:MAG: HIT domain-containing protein [Phycicoccus sp.]|nr:HIT domain-containing protein [Phycicoccus sp.]NMM34004.1 HIT domain-containing protein [Phycicoccus sp.]
MFNHEPPHYRCPFCAFARGEWDEGHAVWDLTRRVAVAMRETFDCAGISTRQHNEPAEDQDVWHLHVHVFPRHQGVALYRRHDDAGFAPPKERALWAALLRDQLSGLSVETVAR